MNEETFNAGDVIAGRIQRLNQIHQHVRNRLQQLLRDCPINESQFLLLSILREPHRRPLSQAEMAERLGVSKAQMSVMVDHLKELDWICPQRCSRDRRRQYWSLTTSGLQEWQRLTHLLQSHFGDLTAAEEIFVALERSLDTCPARRAA